MGANNSSSQSTKAFDPANCRCRTSQYKFKWCECGRSRPSNEPPTKIRFWIDTEKIRKGEPYDALKIPEYAKTDKDRERDRDPAYQALIRDLRSNPQHLRDASK